MKPFVPGKNAWSGTTRSHQDTINSGIVVRVHFKTVGDTWERAFQHSARCTYLALILIGLRRDK